MPHKKTVSIPVVIANRINDPLLAEMILKSGKADAIVMGRASLADPKMPNKAKKGRFGEIKNCLGCLQGCFGHFLKGLPTGCIINSRTGYEKEMEIVKTDFPKNVYVAGGGCARTEAAVAAAKRGHNVTLYEKESKIEFILKHISCR